MSLAAQIILDGGDAMRADWCDECGARHTPSRRQAILKRLDPAVPVGEILDLFAHFWPAEAVRPGHGRESQMLRRDLRAIGRPPVPAEFRLRRGMA